jgi:hypothetical protein
MKRRQKNGEQIKNRMRARAMNGLWIFQGPLYEDFPLRGFLRCQPDTPSRRRIAAGT